MLGCDKGLGEKLVRQNVRLLIYCHDSIQDRSPWRFRIYSCCRRWPILRLSFRSFEMLYGSTPEGGVAGGGEAKLPGYAGWLAPDRLAADESGCPGLLVVEPEAPPPEPPPNWTVPVLPFSLVIVSCSRGFCHSSSVVGPDGSLQVHCSTLQCLQLFKVSCTYMVIKVCSPLQSRPGHQ